MFFLSLSLFLSSLYLIATQDFDAATPPDPKVLAEKLEMKDGMGSLNRYKSRSSPKWIKIVVIYFSIVIEIEPK